MATQIIANINVLAQVSGLIGASLTVFFILDNTRFKRSCFPKSGKSSQDTWRFDYWWCISCPCKIEYPWGKYMWRNL